MGSFIRNGIRLSKKTVNVSYRSTPSTARSKPAVVPKVFEDISDKDHPTELEQNPFEKEKQQCILCKLNIEPDYKNVRLLSQFQSVYTGRIYGKHITGLCEEKQKKVEHEIMKAQNSGLMAYYLKDPRYTHDPKIFDPDHPFKPNKF